MKRCPYCAEEIQDEAIVCKHCGRDLLARALPQAPPAPPPRVVVQGRKEGCFLQTLNFGCIVAVVVGLLATAFCVYVCETVPSSTPAPGSSPSTPQPSSVAKRVTVPDRPLTRAELAARAKEEASKPKPTPEGISAAIVPSACRDLVERNLKAPSTAKFESRWGFEATKVKGKKNTFELYSYVDSQNSFGAMIRTRFHCTASYVAGDVHDPSSWTIRVKTY